MSLKSDGLTDIGFGPGLTTNFQVQYDDSLGNVANLKANCNSLLAVIENEFTVTTGWFATPTGKFGTGNRQVVRLNKPDGSGANNSGYGNPINLDAQSGNGNATNAAGIVGMVFMNEWVEILMSLSGGKWNAGDSMGEALSQYAGIVRFQTGHYNYYNSWTQQWMNKTPRQDWVNQTEGTDGNAISFGCGLGFIYYLKTQLNFTINQIIAAGASNFTKVYQSLTGDNSDPYPFFSGLLEHVYPSSATTNLPGPITDDPFPLAELSFWVDKSTFGKDEVQDVIKASGGTWSRAFWLVVDGFSKNSFNALGVTVGAFTGAFTSLNGVTIIQKPDIDFENAAQPQAAQRIRIPFDVHFNSSSLSAFPASGSATYELDCNLTIGGKAIPGSNAATLFELVAGADPYFTNVDPAQNNVFYLSQDLRLFSATPALNKFPVPGGPMFPSDDFNGAYSYTQQLLTWLNATYNDPNGTDPFNSLLPAQGTALQSDSSVNPFTVTFSTGFPPLPVVSRNYSFAVARVRLRGTAGPAGTASDVRVFFRLWSTQTADTDYAPALTYPSNNDGSGNPKSPLVGAGNGTLPFFATGNIGANSDYPGPNSRDITIPSGDSVWAYFGCFLNLYDPANQVGGQPVLALLNGTHHCLVAQLAFNGAPVPLGSSPEASDKLAQRNLQVTGSDNPGGPEAHRIPQTFDIRPSAKIGPADQPDELMIDWGNVPVGSLASIYWPQALASDVLALAKDLYGTQTLTASDPHTLQCRVTGGVTYVPIPAGAGESFAGLFTVDLPTTVVVGQEFNIVVRRVATKAVPPPIIINTPPRHHSLPSKDVMPAKVHPKPAPPPPPPLPTYRYIVGTFQVKIPVATSDSLLVPEMNTLAIMKWRLAKMAPANRWYPVLKRYIDYISGRVGALGGDPGAILPSPDGVPPDQSGPARRREFTGKVCEVVYDCFGEFEGFVLCACCDETLVFKSRKRGIEEVVLRACRDRLTVIVVVDPKDKTKICAIALRC